MYAHGCHPVLLFSRARPAIVVDAGFMTDEYVGAVHPDARDNDIRDLRRLAQSVDIIVLSTNEAASRLREVARDLEAQIRVAATYVLDVDPIPQYSIPIKWHACANKKTSIVFIGRDGKRKGVFQFLEALGWLKANETHLFERIDVTVVTDDAKVGRLVYELRADFAHFRGLEYDDVKTLLLGSHILCMPTQREAFGLVYLEAMAHGCAVIADNRFPRIETLESGEAGILVDPTDPIQIALSIKQLVLDPQLAVRIACACRHV